MNTYTSIFGDLTKQIQFRIDAASELKKRLFDNSLYEKYLDWDTPTIGFDFTEILGLYNISIAAASGDGNEPIMGTEGLETFAQRVVKHSIGYPMTNDDYRKVLQILDSRTLSDPVRRTTLVNLMWKNVQAAVDGVRSKLDMIFLGALSNEGKFTFDATTNPEGGARGEIDYKMPSDNKAMVTTSWTAENINTVDCFEDMQAILDTAQDKVVLSKILLSQSKLSYILRNKKMRTAIFGTDKASTPLLLATLNEFMQQNSFPTFEVMRRKVRIQNNGTPVEYTPWNNDNIVFIPEGKLGVIKNAFADSELRTEVGVSYANAGRIRIAQWGIGETQGSNGVEQTKASVYALPVITEINGIYSLNTIRPE
jgi:hypothetical protein